MFDGECEADKRLSLENDTLIPQRFCLLVDEKLHWVTLEGREAIRDESGVRESHLQRRKVFTVGRSEKIAYGLFTVFACIFAHSYAYISFQKKNK